MGLGACVAQSVTSQRVPANLPLACLSFHTVIRGSHGPPRRRPERQLAAVGAMGAVPLRRGGPPGKARSGGTLYLADLSSPPLGKPGDLGRSGLGSVFRTVLGRNVLTSLCSAVSQLGA